MKTNEVILEEVKTNPSVLKEASPDSLYNPEFIKKVLEANINSIMYIPPLFRSDPSFILELLKLYPKQHSIIMGSAVELSNNVTFILSLLELFKSHEPTPGFILEFYAEPELRNKKLFIIDALERGIDPPGILHATSKELKQDPDFVCTVYEVLSKSYSKKQAWWWIGSWIGTQINNYLLELIKIDQYVLMLLEGPENNFLSKETHRQLILDALKQIGDNLLKDIPTHWLENADFLIEAMKIRRNALAYSLLQSNPIFVFTILKRFGISVLEHIHDLTYILNFPMVVDSIVAFVADDLSVLKDAPEKLINNSNFMLALAKTHPSVLDSAPDEMLNEAFFHRALQQNIDVNILIKHALKNLNKNINFLYRVLPDIPKEITSKSDNMIAFMKVDSSALQHSSLQTDIDFITKAVETFGADILNYISTENLEILRENPKLNKIIDDFLTKNDALWLKNTQNKLKNNPDFIPNFEKMNPSMWDDAEHFNENHSATEHVSPLKNSGNTNLFENPIKENEANPDFMPKNPSSMPNDAEQFNENHSAPENVNPLENIEDMRNTNFFEEPIKGKGANTPTSTTEKLKKGFKNFVRTHRRGIGVGVIILTILGAKFLLESTSDLNPTSKDFKDIELAKSLKEVQAYVQDNINELSKNEGHNFAEELNVTPAKVMGWGTAFFSLLFIGNCFKKSKNSEKQEELLESSKEKVLSQHEIKPSKEDNNITDETRIAIDPIKELKDKESQPGENISFQKDEDKPQDKKSQELISQQIDHSLIVHTQTLPPDSTEKEQTQAVQILSSAKDEIKETFEKQFDNINKDKKTHPQDIKNIVTKYLNKLKGTTNKSIFTWICIGLLRLVEAGVRGVNRAIHSIKTAQLFNANINKQKAMTDLKQVQEEIRDDVEQKLESIASPQKKI